MATRCGDNVDYGYRFSRDFVDTPEREINPDLINSPVSFDTNQTEIEGKRRKPLRRRRIRRQMNIHNNEVGRRVNNQSTLSILINLFVFSLLRLFID